jgi:hypothetical protein
MPFTPHRRAQGIEFHRSISPKLTAFPLGPFVANPCALVADTAPFKRWRERRLVTRRMEKISFADLYVR